MNPESERSPSAPDAAEIPTGLSPAADRPGDAGGAPDRRRIDLPALRAIKQRFLRVNRERLQRIRAALTSGQRDFLDLLPLLFHTNYPLFPGFVGKTTPFGLAEYSPEHAALAAARRITLSFDFKRRAARTVDIHALYAMGSIGTVAHSKTSDLDVWVCHRPDLGARERAELGQKTDALTAWAASLGLEVHFFNLSAESFRGGATAGLSSESSGSAQHDLLLDEFYRTSVLIAGRYPVWWLVPPDLEAEHADVVAEITRRRLVNPLEFVDFGTVSELPASEFVGAALWQLTKAIGSPHKSLLKIMLLEAYAQEYPNPTLLSLLYKSAVYRGERSLDALDPYVLFARKVEDYLAAAGDEARLDLARKSFYFKVNVPLSQARRGAESDWRHRLVREVVDGWGWDRSTLADLDARPSWKIDGVLHERQAVVSALTHTYKFIRRFAREHAEEARLSQHDLTILGRKLFAAFEHKAGKVEIVSRGVANDLSEAQLTVVHRGGDAGWSLYRGHPPELDRVEPVKRGHTLIELLAWAYFNGVLVRSTRVTVQQPDVAISARDIETLHGHLRQHFPPDLVRIPDVEDVARPPELLAAAAFVNLGIDPLASYTRQGKRLTSSQVDALSYGGLHENLVHEIDYVLITSWREVLAFKFEGIAGLLDCLREHLGWAARAERLPLPAVPCSCLTPSYAHAITVRVSRLFEDVTTWYRSHPEIEHKVYVLKGGDHFYALRAEGSSVTADYIGPPGELVRYLARPRSAYTAVAIDRFALANSPLELVYRHQIPGEIRCHYQVEEREAHLYIVDERGTLFYDRTPFHRESTLVRHLQAFFDSVQYRRDSTAPLEEAGSTPVSFFRVARGDDQRLRLQAVAPQPLSRGGLGFHLQVIGERVDGRAVFTLYCEDREFSTLEHGEEVFEAIAEHILRRRADDTRYPIYITDIDLTGLREDDGGRQLQTIHYLMYKKRIEDRLNEVIAAADPRLRPLAAPAGAPSGGGAAPSVPAASSL